MNKTKLSRGEAVSTWIRRHKFLIMGILVPALAAGASIIGQGINAFSQGSVNKKTRKWNEEMYAKQRADSLSDWNMQNQYNSPEQQMQRLRAAGLNPNLVYGEGTVANSSAVPRAASMDAWRPSAPQFDGSVVGQSLMQMYDIELKEAQTNNAHATTQVLAQDALLRAAQVAATVQQTARSEFELGQAQELSTYVIEQAKQNVRSTATSTDVMLSRNEREIATAQQSLSKGAEEILNLRASRAKTSDERALLQQQIENLRKDATIKQLEINLRKLGINPSDPQWQRVLGQLVAGFDPAKIKIDAKPGKWADGLDSSSRANMGIPPKDGGDPYRNR